MAYILVVDDDRRILGLLVEILTREGHTVVAVPNAFEALDALRYREPDLILSDLDMPDLDGRDLFRAVCQYHPKLPFVAITDDLKATQEGFAGVIPRPFRIDELKTVVDAALNHISQGGTA